MKDTNHVVILLIIKDGQILLEKRQFNGGENFIFPGGRIKEHELEQLEMAAIREAQEELGITPTKIIPVLQEEDYFSETGKLIRPFVVIEWEGEFPEAVLDTNAPLIWQNLEEALNSPVLSVRDLAKAAKAHLTSAA